MKNIASKSVPSSAAQDSARPPRSPMLAVEKKQAVLEFVRVRKVCATRDIIDTLGIPKVTTHRLITDLEAEGKVEKVHGGVRACPEVHVQRDFYRRLQLGDDAKTAIARRAMRLVSPGATLFLDASTTCLHLARQLALAGGPACVIVTHSSTVCHELCGCAHLRVICTGGELDHAMNLLGGSLALEAISKLNFSDAFVSAGGASPTYGATTWESNIVKIISAVKSRAQRTYLLVDSTKFTKLAPHTIAPLNEFAGVITDSAVPANTREALTAAGVNLLM